jgi:hypothetical protein
MGWLDGDDSGFSLSDNASNYSLGVDTSFNANPFTDNMMLPGSMYAGGGAGGGFMGGLQGLLGGLGGSQGQGGMGGDLGGLGGLMKLLGIGLGGGGALASLFGQGSKQTQTPKMSGDQRDAMNAYRGAIGQQLPQQQAMFNQGAGMLNNLQQGQIPQGLTNTVQAAYNPFVQQAGQNAIEQSQRAGFALPQDAFTGGPGLRIMGNAMAQLPGMEANTTLNTMFPLISTLMGQGQQGVGNLGNAFNSFPTGQQTQNDPSLAQRFQGMGPFLQGIGNIMNPPQYNLQMMNPITGFGGQNGYQQPITVTGQQST